MQHLGHFFGSAYRNNHKWHINKKYKIRRQIYRIIALQVGEPDRDLINRALMLVTSELTIGPACRLGKTNLTCNLGNNEPPAVICWKDNCT